MAASRHSGDSHRDGHTALAGPDMRPVETLLDHGLRLRLTSPEVALVFGERAAALAEAGGSEDLWIRAEALAVFAHVRLGRRAPVVDRAMAAMRAAEAGGHDELAGLLRTDIALCARSVGAPLTGLAVLRPVLAETTLPPVVRAAALVQLVGCMTSLGRREVLDRALVDADELISGDTGLDADGRTLLRVMVRARSTAHLRRNGDLAAAMESAERGIDLLRELSDPSVDGTELGTRLTLELVCALLDQGATEDAAAIAKPLLNRPPRAAAVAPMAWLRLAVATRILLPSGSPEAAALLVRDALYFTGRHGLQALSARLWLELAHIEERLGRPAEALRCLREARAEEHRFGRCRRQALSLLIGEFGRGEQQTVDIVRLLDTVRPAARPVPVPRAAQRSAPVPTPNPRPIVPAVEATQEFALPALAPIPMPAPIPVPAVRLGEPGAQRRPDERAAEERAADARREQNRVDAAEEARPQTPAEDTTAAKHADAAASAKAVLERLGISVGGGGRRRARHAEGGEHSARGEAAPVSGTASEAAPDAAPAVARHAEPALTELPALPRPARDPEPVEEKPSPAPENILLPRLRMPGTLAPDALRLVTGEASDTPARGTEEISVEVDEAVEDLRPEEPPQRALQPEELDSLLAVFSSNWADEAKPTDIGPRVRRRWPERTRPGLAPVDPGGANGRVVNGERPAGGRHQGDR